MVRSVVSLGWYTLDFVDIDMLEENDCTSVRGRTNFAK